MSKQASGGNARAQVLSSQTRKAVASAAAKARWAAKRAAAPAGESDAKPKARRPGLVEIPPALVARIGAPPEALAATVASLLTEALDNRDRRAAVGDPPTPGLNRGPALARVIRSVSDSGAQLIPASRLPAPTRNVAPGVQVGPTRPAPGSLLIEKTYRRKGASSSVPAAAEGAS
jgi:hypothetical protein